MKKIIILYFVAIITCLLQAQETFTYSNSDKDYFDGKELFVQQKYAASMISFEKFREEQKNSDPDRLQQAEYYIAYCAYELGKDNAAYLLETYLKKYPYTQFESPTCLLLGNLAFRDKKYNAALAWYERANEKRLSKTESADLLFYRGCTYIETEDYNKAKTTFKTLMGQDTRYNNSAIYYYSFAEYSLKNYDAALDGFLKIEPQPEYADFVPYYIVQIYYQQKKYDELMPYAERILQKNPTSPNNAEIYRILGECAYRKQDYAKTIEYITAYEKIAPKVLRNDMYILGISYYKTNDFSKAANYLAKVTTTQDALAQNAYLHLGNSYVELNKKDNARMAFETASKMDFDKEVKEEAAYNYILSTFETTAPFGEAIKAFEAFLTDYPNSKYKDDVYENLVTVYMTTKNYQAASESLDKIKNLSPAMKDVKAYILFQLGTEEFVREDYPKAIAYFDNSLTMMTPNFKSAQVYYWRGESHYRMANYVLARKDYEDFFTKKGANEFNNYNLANYNVAYTYFQEKKYQESAPFFQKYIDGEEDKTRYSYGDALNRMGDCYFISRNLINAEKYYTQSMNLKGKNGDYAAFQQAIVLGLQKNYNGKINGLQNLLKDYPTSDYEDDAYYEMARAYVLLENEKNAIGSYSLLIRSFPHSPLAQKAALEIGMLHYNTGKYDEAIDAYKRVVFSYPNSAEARTALESLESIYVEQNKVADYFDYTKTLANGIVMISPTKEDSLTYLAAENLYMKSRIEEATTAFERYISEHCPGGISCMHANFYLADCYYVSNKTNEAIQQYRILSEMEGNPYMEPVLVRLAQLSYDNKDYELSLKAFQKLQLMAQEPENITAAKIGILRSSYLLNDAQSIISIATEILKNKDVDVDLERESRYYLAKAYIQIGEREKALDDLQILAKDLRTVAGAEAKYQIADYYFTVGDDKKAEVEISDFIAFGTPHQYWMARAFVLLADIYIKRGDDFQAKQYLLSLQENYPSKDSIQDLIEERLDGISSREKAKIQE